jgi:hypothetical protein
MARRGRERSRPAPGGHRAGAGRVARLDVLSGFAADFASLAPAVTRAEAHGLPRVPGVLSRRALHRRAGPRPARLRDGRGLQRPRGLGSAGLAQHVLESLQPDPSPFVRSLSPRRFFPRTWDWEPARDQAEQVYQNYYSLPPRRGARDR